MIDNESEKVIKFVDAAIKHICGYKDSSKIKIMDIGCYKGELVGALLDYGYDAYGCDFRLAQDSSNFYSNRLLSINSNPYRLPFSDNQFDVVVSTSVLEHVKDKELFFKEIYRVLKIGGYSMHTFPSKYYLPWETHSYVPLVNFFWPKCPKFLLGLSALLKICKASKRMPYKEAIKFNYNFCINEVFYWSNREIKNLSIEIFNNYSSPMEFFINNSYGGFARLFKMFPFKKFSGWLCSEIRNNFIIQIKKY